jgi:hypothetical protein
MAHALLKIVAPRSANWCSATPDADEVGRLALSIHMPAGALPIIRQCARPLEHGQEKWKPIFHEKAQPNKD